MIIFLSGRRSWFWKFCYTFHSLPYWAGYDSQVFIFEGENAVNSPWETPHSHAFYSWSSYAQIYQACLSQLTPPSFRLPGAIPTVSGPWWKWGEGRDSWPAAREQLFGFTALLLNFPEGRIPCLFPFAWEPRSKESGAHLRWRAVGRAFLLLCRVLD